MPIFEYKCKKCGAKSEFLEKSGSSKKHKCEKCGSDEMQKVVSTFSAGSSSKSTQSGSCPTGTCPLS
ncbi:putative regulatory protein, FmdB family [Limihaloglobus sulfuriphilus]|uniref:Putative regulatory protein, FmdB family n=1 Tax=Limihaloglobus sulfuriphilus TaxID=1851148 RepID=A0A1Q2MGL8_9BACT|nr:zinc ribbon domain-containing protein [Limihaloglobus sulfuriphilus]AQQ71794.1 putative regulatory protein, FmdB family [Limihaloglobus sulfuriphilus]